jgi:hypothetical protein
MGMCIIQTYAKQMLLCMSNTVVYSSFGRVDCTEILKADYNAGFSGGVSEFHAIHSQVQLEFLRGRSISIFVDPA